MPPEWETLCIPDTWQPELVSCTFEPSTLSGSVVDARGLPAAGICIGAQGATWSRSDSTGSWAAALSGLHDVTARVWDCGSGSPFGFQPQDVALRFEIGEHTNIQVVVVPFGGIRGHVVDDGGNPVAGACLASGGRQDLPPVGPTTATGTFELTGVRPGSHQVFVAPCPGSTAIHMVELEQTIVVTTAGAWSQAEVPVSVGTVLG